MLFHSSLRKELARSFGATLVVLVIIVMTMTLIRTLGQASRGNVNPSEVTLVMGYLMLAYAPTILTLSLFIAVVASLSRLHRDSEMVIWQASGRGLAAFLGPVLRFAWPVLAAIAALAFVVWPWANQQTLQLRERYGQRGDLERVAPGQFQESASGRRVFFLDKDQPADHVGRNIFIAAKEHEREIITSARSGSVLMRGDAPHLVLSQGQRLELALDGSQLRVAEFDQLSSRIGGVRLALSGQSPAKAQPTLRLLADPTRLQQAELAWRLGLFLAACNLLLMALCVSAANPRVGRSGNLLFALFAFIVYYNLLNLGQSWIASGRASLAGFLLGLHGSVFVLATLWLAGLHGQWGWLRGWRPRRQSAKALA